VAETNRGAPRLPARALLVAASLVSACHRSSLPPRPDGAAVVVAPEAMDDGLPAVPESEPDDSLATAMRLAVSPTSPVAVAGSLRGGVPGAKRDVDFYRIDAPAPDAGTAGTVGTAAADAATTPPARALLRADLRPEPPLALILDALDATGHVLVSAPGQPGEAIAIPNLAVLPGAVYLRVRAATVDTASGGYRLAVRLGPFDTGAEIEPNGSAALATELLPGGEAVGYLGWRHDQDFYRLPTAGLAEGCVLTVDLDPVPGVGASLQLTGSDGQKLGFARGRKGERVVMRDVRVPPGDPQLFLVVRAEDKWSADARYNLRPHADLPRPGTEAEPNDDPAHAQPIADGTVLGYLGGGDVDVFRYTTEVPAQLEVELVPPEGARVRVEILRADGTLLARAQGVRSRPIRIANLAIPGGPVLVRLAGARGVASPDEPYHLSVSSHPAAPAGDGSPKEE
jgi:hypothetical protein